ncbi:hypothetical protein ABZV67_39360 [Streptomyces sp. NPDC005065]|uniref:hypothetical protein n=1 Tax=Streptomyces sp. NPDC005065 TaxID=3154461 RepID=UPI0033A7FCCA
METFLPLLVRGGRVTGRALGGLNYQIEHHLFPNMPTLLIPICDGRTASGESTPLQVAGFDRSRIPWREWSVLLPFTVRRRTSAGPATPNESTFSRATMQETDRHSAV